MKKILSFILLIIGVTTLTITVLSNVMVKEMQKMIEEEEVKSINIEVETDDKKEELKEGVTEKDVEEKKDEIKTDITEDKKVDTSKSNINTKKVDKPKSVYTCNICLKVKESPAFYTNKSDGVYMCKPCHDSTKDAEGKTEIIYVNCEWCGKTYDVDKGIDSSYCSNSCKNNAIDAGGAKADGFEEYYIEE